MGEVIFGHDFKRANPKADRAFWIGPPDPLEVMAREILDQIESDKPEPDQSA